MDAQQLLKQYAAGKRDFRGVDLRGADLTLADLSHANLEGANLSQAILNGITLIQTNLFQANLSNAKLLGADLSGANLIQANLNRALLSSAILAGTYISKANLSAAVLSGANLQGATLRGATFKGTNLSGADLGQADLLGAETQGIDLSAAILANTIMPDGTLGDSVSLEAAKESPAADKTVVDDSAIIQKFIQGERANLSSQTLWIEPTLNVTQLMARGELIAIRRSDPAAFSVKHGSGFWDQINQSLLANSFIPLGRPAHEQFTEYEHQQVPQGKLNYTVARDLWKVWWPHRRRSLRSALQLNLLIFKQNAWYPVQEIIHQEGTLYIQTPGKEMTLYGTDWVVWLS